MQTTRQQSKSTSKKARVVKTPKLLYTCDDYTIKEKFDVIKNAIPANCDLWFMGTDGWVTVGNTNDIINYIEEYKDHL